MKRFIFGKSTGNLPDERNSQEALISSDFFGWNIFDWHLRVNIAIELIDGDFFYVTLDLNSVYFSVRHTMRISSKVTSIDAHQEFLIGDDNFDGEAVASEKVIAS